MHCAVGNSFCVAMAQMCAVVCLIFRSSSDSSLVRSLMGTGAGPSAEEASGSATALLAKTLAWRRPKPRVIAEATPGATMDATGTAPGRGPAHGATAAGTPRDTEPNPTRRA